MTRGRRYSWYRDDPAAATPPSDPTPRSALFRLGAALAIAEFTRAEPPLDTRPGDAVASANDIIHTPPEVTP